MKGKVVLVHWSVLEAEELAKPLRNDGWQVAVEAEDGARAVRQVLSAVPDVMVVYLTRLPSHGVGTACYLRSVRETSNLPIVFVDGEKDVVARAKDKVPDAFYVGKADLEKVLATIGDTGS